MTPKDLHVVEFFSGIGGMRISLAAALKRLEISQGNDDKDVVRPFRISSIYSIDTSGVVNKCYSHNFPSAQDTRTRNSKNSSEPQRKKRKFGVAVEKEFLRQANIESIKVKDLDGKGNVWTMSPPCQPFTTTDAAKQLGGNDKRNKAFNYLMSLLRKMENRPEWIFFENVKGFENTPVHKEWLETLRETGYVWRQYKISPLSVGIPMNRTRFYMVCRLTNEKNESIKGYGTENIVLEEIPECCCRKSLPFEGFEFKDNKDERNDAELDEKVSGPLTALPLKHFVMSRQEIGEDEYESLIVSDQVLAKPWAEGLSVIGIDDRVTFCFTSSYGQRMHKSSGSTLHLKLTKGKLVEKSADMSKLHSKSIRLFSPKELLRLFGFPSWYEFPPDFKQRHRWKVVGQSISCTVVQNIMHAEFCAAASTSMATGTTETTETTETTD